jgi:hypothetical protein
MSYKTGYTEPFPWTYVQVGNQVPVFCQENNSIIESLLYGVKWRILNN